MSAQAESSGSVRPGRIDITIPHNLLVLPPTAALVGLTIGMSRGGSRARLRFLAENAHRQPKTIQGWYFYTKTRNYRVFFAAAKTGVKYALGLGGATAGFVMLEEGAGWAREKVEVLGDRKGKGRAVDADVEESPRRRDGRQGWRDGPTRWQDGALAGMTMGAGVGFAYTLPRPLFVRSLVIGTLLGATTSGLQTLQEHIGRLRDAEEAGLRLPSTLPPAAHTVSVTPAPTALTAESTATGEHDLVDRNLEKGVRIAAPPVDESVQAPGTRASTTPASTSGGWWSWIPGMGGK